MKEKFKYLPQPILKPVPGCSWADTMVLNPAVFKDKESDDLLMLFRASGPYAEKQLPGASCPPFPIFLGFAVSHDSGITWDADFSRPCLAPALEYEADKIKITNYRGETVTNYANGCVEDPRVFDLEGKTYLTVACRMFPPGPYFDRKCEVYDRSRGNIPQWVYTSESPFGDEARKNPSITVLYEIDVPKLKKGDYEHAFTYICPLTNGNTADNRDAFLFPEKMMIDGRMQYVLLHRPFNPNEFDSKINTTLPSVMIGCADNLEDFAAGRSKDILLEAAGTFEWSANRVGASYPPIRISRREWLLPIHGKADTIGYTQSFYILEERENCLPVITHRCSDRLMYPQQDWEMPDLFPDLCIFATGGIEVNGELIISYGAADQYCGISMVPMADLIEYVRSFNEKGVKVK
jgi:predicted GH43/DUF377 family glycosyl hydrolase